MSVLIWTNKFPVYSETFIRDQIVNLMDTNMKVFIFSGNKKDFSEKEALKGFEKYKLLDCVMDESIFADSIIKSLSEIQQKKCILLNKKYSLEDLRNILSQHDAYIGMGLQGAIFLY